MEDAIEHAQPVMLEHSGLCLLAAEEPASVEQALGEACWKEAMDHGCRDEINRRQRNL